MMMWRLNCIFHIKLLWKKEVILIRDKRNIMFRNSSHKFRSCLLIDRYQINTINTYIETEKGLYVVNIELFVKHLDTDT